jgi:hypothetical protein
MPRSRVSRREAALRRMALQRTAHHEAAHGVADLVFGHKPQLVSIRHTDRYNGVCQSDHRMQLDGFRADLSVPQQAPGIRANVETEIIATLAGPIAGQAFWPDSLARRAADADEQAARQAVDALGSRYRELLSDLETGDEPLSSDEDKVAILSAAFAGPTQATAYYMWLRAAAIELVTDRQKQIHAVAEALLRRTVLTGDEIAAIAKAAR